MKKTLSSKRRWKTRNGDQNQRIRQQQWLWCYTALGGEKMKRFFKLLELSEDLCSHADRPLFQKKQCYTIDALAAIFAIFTIVYKTFTKLIQYFHNTFTILLEYLSLFKYLKIFQNNSKHLKIVQNIIELKTLLTLLTLLKQSWIMNNASASKKYLPSMLSFMSMSLPLGSVAVCMSSPLLSSSAILPTFTSETNKVIVIGSARFFSSVTILGNKKEICDAFVACLHQHRLHWHRLHGTQLHNYKSPLHRHKLVRKALLCLRWNDFQGDWCAKQNNV